MSQERNSWRREHPVFEPSRPFPVHRQPLQPKTSNPPNLPSTHPPPPPPPHYQPPLPTLAPSFPQPNSPYNYPAGQSLSASQFSRPWDAPHFQPSWPAPPSPQSQLPQQNHPRSPQPSIDRYITGLREPYRPLEPPQNAVPPPPPPLHRPPVSYNNYQNSTFNPPPPSPTAARQAPAHPRSPPPACPPFQPGSTFDQFDRHQSNPRPPRHRPPHLDMPEVIDLTGSSPPGSTAGRGPARRIPRASSDIIDVDSLPDRPARPANQTPTLHYPPFQNMPLFSRGPRTTAPPPPPPRLQPPVTGGSTRQRRDHDYSSRIAHDRQARQHQIRQQQEMERHNRDRERLHDFLRYGFQMGAQLLGGGSGVRPGGSSGSGQRRLPFQAPAILDYSQPAPAFIRANSPQDAAALRNVDYKAPPPCKEGFTRSPKASDVLQCPECDHELGTKSLDEFSEEVWAAKCGHVYCGRCAHSIREPTLTGQKRTRSKRKQCVVTDCRTNLLTKGGMFKIHL